MGHYDNKVPTQGAPERGSYGFKVPSEYTRKKCQQCNYVVIREVLPFSGIKICPNFQRTGVLPPRKKTSSIL
jgi:hypothetical protein